MKEYVPSVVVIKLARNPSLTRLKEICLDKRHIPFQNKLRQTDDIRKLPPESLISKLMNSNDNYVNLRLVVFISSCFEMKEKLICAFLEYWINVVPIYINVAIVA